MSEREMLGLIDKMPPNGWWHASTGDTFKSVALEMVEHGYSPEEVLGTLERLHGAVAEEYGA